MDMTGCTHLRHPVVVSSAEATDKANVVEMTDLLVSQLRRREQQPPRL